MANKYELIKRIISGINLGCLFIVASLLEGRLLQILLILTLIAMLYEWLNINFYSKNSDHTQLYKHEVTLNLFSNSYTLKNPYLYIIGNIYIILPMLYWIMDPTLYILIPLLTVWSSDTFAYFGGKLFKGPKMAPKISPGKTWSGTICGFLMGIVVYYYMDGDTLINIYKFIILLICSVLGDLLESKTKRILNVKDSGKLIPGHGGILDRFDSFLLVSYAYILLH